MTLKGVHNSESIDQIAPGHDQGHDQGQGLVIEICRPNGLTINLLLSIQEITGKLHYKITLITFYRH